MPLRNSPIFLQEELEVPYEVKIYERVGWGAPPSFKAVHPLGKSPIITDGDLTLPESGAIIDYIIRKYGQGRIELPSEGKALTDELYCELWFLFGGCERILTCTQFLIPRKHRSCR